MSEVTGIEQVRGRFQHMRAVAIRLARAGTKAGATVLSRRMRDAAPVRRTRKVYKGVEIPPGRAKASIGARALKKQEHVAASKAGIGVGKKRAQTAPHAHLVTLGTQVRFTGFKGVGRKKKVLVKTSGIRLNRGRMPANPYLRLAVQAASQEAQAAMDENIRKGIAREAAKRGFTPS